MQNKISIRIIRYSLFCIEFKPTAVRWAPATCIPTHNLVSVYKNYLYGTHVNAPPIWKFQRNANDIEFTRPCQRNSVYIDVKLLMFTHHLTSDVRCGFQTCFLSYFYDKWRRIKKIDKKTRLHLLEEWPWLKLHSMEENSSGAFAIEIMNEL